MNFFVKNRFVSFFISLTVLIGMTTSCVDEHAGHNHAKGEHDHSTGEQIIIELDDPGYVKHVEWSKNATIYEANIRQITPEGTLKAFEGQLESIQELGIKIIWLMPVQPIGELNRKGGLGSPYSIKDYTAVNPDFGDLNDFKSLVKRAHELDMKIILDWVANHSAWDNQWTIDHPEYYTKDSLGDFMPPNPDWSDVLDLNYDNKEMRVAMIDAMKYWVTECDIDGFRCDVAWNVPLDFWNRTREELDAIKPIFILAEAEEENYHEEAFDMSYGWELMHLLKHVVNGDSTVNSIDKYMLRQKDRFTKNDYRMHFLTTHDENSWNGTIEERFGESEKAIAVLTYTIYGMPLIYSGQEYGNNKALAFFEKDNPTYTQPEIFDFYKTLITLNRDNKALWNGEYGGDYESIENTLNDQVFSFKRQKDNDVIISIINLTDKPVRFKLLDIEPISLVNVFLNEEIEINDHLELELPAYGYYLLKQ